MSQPSIVEPLAIIAAAPRPAVRLILHRAAFWSAIVAICITALVLGLILRRYAWDETEPIRYQLDINNAFRQGSASWETGYVDRYDERTSQANHQANLDLDYAPGRLAVATLWARWVRQQVDWSPGSMRGLNPWLQEFYPHARELHLQYQLCKPMLMLNLTGEILSAIAMFFLVRRYTSGRPPNLRSTRGIILGLFSALLFWFNPALIWNAHCWPQWDSWVLPFFLWALLLASLNWWFCAGVLIATGAMFKGQILFGAPLLLLWPLFQGRLTAVLRWIVGLATATAGITAVWLVRIPGTNPTGKLFFPGSINPHAIEWVVCLAMIFAAVTLMLWGPRKSRIRFPVSLLAAITLTWIIGTYTNHQFSIFLCVLFAAGGWWIEERCSAWNWKVRRPLALTAMAILIFPIYVLAKGAPGGQSALLATGMQMAVNVVIAADALGLLILLATRRAIPFAAAGWLSAALLICMPLFHTSRGWLDLGFLYGTYHFENMSRGEPNNLAELLEVQWQWDDLMEPAVTLPRGALSDSIADFLVAVDPGAKLERIEQSDGSIGLPLKYLLVGVWIVSVILCSIGAAMHDRNRSPRFLAAISTPYIMFFAVMVQMHQRYLLWGASLSAATAVLSPGFTALHLFLSVVAMSQEMHSMLGDDRKYWNSPVYRFLENWHPGIAWAVLLCAAIFLYTTLKWEKPGPESDDRNV